jgi:hypothetical protein
MRDTYCVFFSGRCEDVGCQSCPDVQRKPPSEEVQEFGGKWLVPEIEEQDVFDQPPRKTEIPEGADMSFVPVNAQGALDPDDVALFMPDNVNHPPHYARWTTEPIEFIAINNLPWWLANVIKYTMRFDAKDGLQDLYKARSYLQMKINELEGVKRFWDAPVTEERALKQNDVVVLQALKR